MHPTLRTVPRARVALDGGDAFAANTAGARHAATSPWSGIPAPTKRQEQSGVYPKGYMTWQGLGILIENPHGTVREGTDPDGKAWRNVMKAGYGYIAGTMGADGDELDVFVGPAPESAACWVINQRTAPGAFDEHKLLVGFPDERSAVDAYRLSYSPGWDRYGPPVALSLPRLKWWIANGDLTRELSPESVPQEFHHMDAIDKTIPIARVFWDSAAEPQCGETTGGLLYALRVHDTDGLMLDAVTMADVMEGEDGKEVLDALVVQAGRLAPKMNALMSIMGVAGGELSVLGNQISDPVRRFGGAHVAAIFELSDGQTVTAWFHNPDSSPTKLSPADELVSWKWQLNKKDVTIVVAPESGRDLNVREVARRIMRLAAKNSAAFAKANAGRAGRMAEIQGLRETLGAKQAELGQLQSQIEGAKVDRDGRTAALAAMTGEQAFNLGKAAGAAGDPRMTPVNFPKDHARSWLEGWEAAKREEEEARAEPDDEAKAATVQAAYKFDNASTEFLAWLYGSIDSEDYSPFMTAKTMDATAKAGGAGVEWGFFTRAAAMDAVGGWSMADISKPGFARALAASPKKFGLDKIITKSSGGAVSSWKTLDADGIKIMRNVIANAVTGGDMRKQVDLQPALKALSADDIEKVYQAVRAAMGIGGKLDGVKDGDDESKPTAPAGSDDATANGSENAEKVEKAKDADEAKAAKAEEGEKKPEGEKPAAAAEDEAPADDEDEGEDFDAEAEFNSLKDDEEDGEKAKEEAAA